MRKPLKTALAAAIALALIALGVVTWSVYPLLLTGSAYKSKVVCSAVFVSRRPAASVLAEDVRAGELRILDLFRTRIDNAAGTVTSSFFGLAPVTAVFREGIGATLAHGVSPDTLRAEPRPGTEPPLPDPDLPWPRGSRVDTTDFSDGIDGAGLARIVASAFEEPLPSRPLRTRAVVVVHDGGIIAERYAPGITAETPLTGWSMTKSVINALVGILVRDGKLSLDDDALLAEWRAEPGDPRAAIALDDLMRMSDGLDFSEKYDDLRGDVPTMLFRVKDASSFAAVKTLEAEPGERWNYSSGTTNIVCRVIRQTIGDDATYHAFPYRELFHRIGATSAVLERDASGTFVGSSFMFATARDWARLGLLFANDGVWDGERILPEGWVDYSRTPAPAAPGKVHGAHFWLRIIQRRSDLEKDPVLPAGAFHMSGHEGQFVTIIPEKKLVVVRLGFTLNRGDWDHEQFVAEVLETIPNISTANPEP